MRRRELRTALVALALAGALACAGSGSAPAPGTSRVFGTLRLVPHEGAPHPSGGGGSYASIRLRDAGLVDYSTPGFAVVFVDESARPGESALVTIRDTHVAPRLEPDHLAIAVGQSVDMPNDDQIFHNVFSFSKPNDFDLGLYPSGQSRRVTFEHAGVVKIYCSIHESMSGTIFVSPSPWFAVARANGDFEIAGVPPGAHTLRVWNEKLPETARPVVLAPGAKERIDIELEAGDR